MSSVLSIMRQACQPSRDALVVGYLETQYAPLCPHCREEVFVNTEVPSRPWFNTCPNGHGSWYKMRELPEDLLTPTGT